MPWRGRPDARSDADDLVLFEHVQVGQVKPLQLRLNDVPVRRLEVVDVHRQIRPPQLDELAGERLRGQMAADLGQVAQVVREGGLDERGLESRLKADRKSTRLNSSH